MYSIKGCLGWLDIGETDRLPWTDHNPISSNKLPRHEQDKCNDDRAHYIILQNSGVSTIPPCDIRRVILGRMEEDSLI